jgi:hypothetical protein
MCSYQNCPRCGERSFEKLSSYSHCPNCLYFEDKWQNPETPYVKALHDIAEIEKEQFNTHYENNRKDSHESKKSA